MRKTIKVCSATSASTASSGASACLALMFSRITFPTMTCPAILPSYRERHPQNGKCSGILRHSGLLTAKYAKNAWEAGLFRQDGGRGAHRRGDGQFEHHAGAPGFHVEGVYVAAVLFHDAVADAESQAGSFA